LVNLTVGSEMRVSQGFEFGSRIGGVGGCECWRFGMGESGGGESKSVDFRVTLDVSDAAKGRVVKVLLFLIFPTCLALTSARNMSSRVFLSSPRR
jgi:hypothetical protein